jgi:GntR family histidine utilization transcriptional repressor
VSTKVREATLHKTILREVEGRILSGEWPPGFRVPFEVDLADHYGCSRMTVNKVMTQLAQSGLVERHRKSGTLVTQPRAQSAVLELHDIETEVKSLGKPYGYALISRVDRLSHADDVKVLELTQAVPIVELKAVHMAGDAPFCVEERRINVGSVPEAQDSDFTEMPPGRWLIEQVPWSAAETRIQALAASTEIAQFLKCRKGTPCLVVERRTWSAAGPITFVRLTYLGTSHILVARFTPTQGGGLPASR